MSSAPAREPEPRECSGLTTRLILAYVDREGGQETVDALLRQAGLEGREAELRDENCWFADRVRRDLFEAAVEVLDDPLAARHVGEASIELNAGQAVKIALRALGSPRLIYSNAVRINAKFNQVHRMDLLALGDDHARLRNVPLDGTPWHPSDCEYNVGLMTAGPCLFGQPPARVRHPICIGRGALECVYDIRWSAPGSSTRSAAAASLAGIGGLVGTSLLAPALLPAAVAGAGGAAAFAAWKTVTLRRRRWQLLQAQLREDSEVAAQLTASLQDLVAGLDLDGVLAKITGNAQAAVGGAEFALLVREGPGMHCRSSSGLSASTIAALERWAREIAVGMDAALVLDDLGSVPALAALPADPDLSLRSLCAAPMTFGGQRVGTLVSLVGAPGGFLPRDVDLLQSYADQAAIALTNARLYAAQEERASRDPLTGLLNHREFHETVAYELERCRRYGNRMSVVLFDLDDFKLVNDTGGHAEGDRVLRSVADALSAACRASDLAFRVGGDEFALVLPETGAEAAAAVAQRVRHQIAAVDRRANASFGLASWPDSGPSKDGLLSRADDDLYASKRSAPGGEWSAVGAEEAQPGAPRGRLAAASRLSARLAPLLDPVEIARAAVEELQASFDPYLVVIHRIHADGMLRPLAGAGPLLDQMSTDLWEWEQPVTVGVNGRTARTGEPTLVADTRRDPDFIGTDAPVQSRSELALPIRVAGEVWGVLNLEEVEPHAFGPDDVLFGDTVAAAVGAALHRGHLFGELESTFMRTLAVLSDALETKDTYTAAHAREVASLAEEVGDALGIAGDDLRNLRYGALLHDIGKIGVRTEILQKPGALTPEEFEEIKQHTVIGAQMLERIPFFASVHPLVRSAHERWDGGGYPDGLVGEEIPLGARVICACDAFHAMTSNRPYRRALPVEVALEELREHAGSQFDPGVVDALLEVLEAAPAVPAPATR